ncbi:MAG TPA: hypothetical protein VFY71_06140 [Planctomycetota bacterium]|nr:hypothetical protein [Planctomycetota bacterium]
MPVAIYVCAPGVAAQNWGPLQGHVVPTTADTHMAIVDLCNAGLNAGMNSPAVGGSAGSTTVGGVSTLQFDHSKLDPGQNYAGYTVCTSSGCQIAFDVADWTSAALTPPIDADVLVGFIATAYHELAHVEYTSYFSSWCDNHATACQSFSDCIATLTDIEGNNLGYDADTNNPCSEAYANGNTANKLCQDKLDVCANGDLTQSVKDALIAQLDAEIQDAVNKCNSQSTDCAICGGPPMPQTFLGCGSACPCP